MTDSVHAVVNLDLPGPVISRHVYGHFAEHLGRCIHGGFWVGEDSDVPNEGGIRLDVVEALRELAIPNLRWPGGCFADEYHWRDGVGPRGERPRMVNSHWGDVVEDNAFGTHEFMALCALLGADAYVAGNVGSGTVREMREWVEYLTRADDSPMADLRRANGRDEPWRVPFWGIGNESWGCGGNMTARAYADLARRYATYVRDHGGNDVVRIAAGANADDYDWTDTLMASIAPDEGPDGVWQGLSLHYYTIPGDWQAKGSATDFTIDEYHATMLATRRMDELLTRHGAIMDVHDPERTIGLVVDEWGTWYDVEPGTNPGFLHQQNTMRDALVASVNFDIFHRHAHRVTMANIAQTVNVLQAMLLTDEATGTLVRTPTFHVFAMNTAHHDARALDLAFPDEVPSTTIDDEQLPLLSGSASVDGDGAMVSLSNLDASNARTVVVDLRGREVVGATARVLTADHVAAHNTAEAPDAVAPTDHPVQMRGGHLEVELPAHSYVAVTLDLTG